MKKHVIKIQLFCILVISINCFAQKIDLNQSLSIINSKYKSKNLLSYDVVSYHKSFVSDTVEYTYETHNVLLGVHNKYGIRDFFTTNQANIPLFGFFENNLYKFNLENKDIHSWSIDLAGNILKRGEFRWSTFSPLIYSNPILDSINWNNKLLQHSIEIKGDTLLLDLEWFYKVDNKFHSDDPDIGSTKIIIKSSLKDSLIYFYQEILNTSKKPQVTTYYFSNYQFYLPKKELDSLMQQFKHRISQGLVTKHEKNSQVSSLRKDINKTFNDTFKLYNLEGDSNYLADFNQRYLILDFWFCGCVPCIRASNSLSKINTNELSNKIKIIGINYIDKSIPKIVQCSENINYNQYFLKSRDEIKFLDYYGAPLIIIYDTKFKKITNIFEGFNDAIESKLYTAISLLD